jgi:hypothetical protein
MNGGQVLRDDVEPGVHADGSLRSWIGYGAEGVEQDDIAGPVATSAGRLVLAGSPRSG